MARDSTESRFHEVLGRFGGAQNVQLVGEVWRRGENRTLLETFLHELFPAELPPASHLLQAKAAADDKGPGCAGGAEHKDSHTAPSTPPAKPERTLHFGLVFFLCTHESLSVRRRRREVREILRDVRERMVAGGAVIGVLMRAHADNGNGLSADGGRSAVSDLLAIMHDVYPERRGQGPCTQVRACSLIPGHGASRIEIQRVACEAITAADELRKIKPRMKSHCFLWRRRRWKDCTEETIQEGTALSVLRYPNGDCVETTDI